ncbi:transposase [Nitratidesulfovibrio vulgaris]|uniref:transposase n=1 Tax=Nitratidesulfovibrio vulgaris TaxID=881 RepID=UPI003556397F
MQAKESIIMRRSRFTEEKSIGIFKQAEVGMTLASLCRQHRMSDATFYKWRSKYGGMDVSEARRWRGLERRTSGSWLSRTRTPCTQGKPRKNG